jgi:hypothetical protein
MDIWIYFMVIRYIYPRFGMLYKKIWQPWIVSQNVLTG